MYKNLIYLFFIICLKLNGQDSSKIAIIVGCGFYEAFHAGISYHIKKEYCVSVNAGFDNHLINNGKYFSGGIGFNIAFLKNFKCNSGNYKLDFQNKIMYWSLHDAYYKWKAISCIPAIRYRIDLNKKMNMMLSAGPSINFVIYNFRKTFEEVGWPHYFQFNPVIQLNYLL